VIPELGHLLGANLQKLTAGVRARKSTLKLKNAAVACACGSVTTEIIIFNNNQILSRKWLSSWPAGGS
jgi:hypothetical protein